ncbi:hypothetical protein [Halomarina litorea]|uniref:hypothetical protein n=1 Tax=Halomarina litorea TaxID=2961595 RepID=UPI0020C479E6|nr:hypothetical protein [Halomarina sp. BCD28]
MSQIVQRSLALPVREARLAVFKPDNDSDDLDAADITVPAPDLDVVSISERIQERKDTAKLVVDNALGQYSGEVTAGDRLAFIADTPINRKRVFGEGPFGSGTFGGYGTLWTGVARPQTRERSGPRDATITIESEDFAFAIASWRQVYDVFEGAPICLPEDDPDANTAIVNTLLREKAPEIDRSKLGRVETITDEFSNGMNLLDVLVELQKKGDAIMASEGRALSFQPLADIEPVGTIGPADVGTYRVRETDDELINVMRVDGGTDKAVDDAQETVTAYQAVTDQPADRITTRISTRKSELARIELWTRADRNEDADGLVVRLQKDVGDGSGPVAIEDTESDITKKQLSAEFLAADGWTRFIMPTHTLPEPNPWLIIESDGPTGQEVGVDAAPTPAYRAYFPFPVSVRVQDPASQREYGLREGRIKDDGLQTFTAARDRGEADLRHRDEPREELEFDCRSLAAHNLDAGQVFTANFPLEDAVGDYVVTEKTTDYAGGRLRTSIVSQEARTL